MKTTTPGIDNSTRHQSETPARAVEELLKTPPREAKPTHAKTEKPPPKSSLSEVESSSYTKTPRRRERTDTTAPYTNTDP